MSKNGQCPMGSDGLKPDQRGLICSVLNKYPCVNEAVLYGSRAMGRFRAGSDIDLTLKGDIDPQTLNAISMDLDDLMLPYLIDLCAWQDIDNEALKEHIKRVGVVFYRA